MKLTPQQQAIFDRLSAPSDDDFTGLIKLAGLDPTRDFRGADLSGMHFGEADLRNFDFRDADLTGADLSRAMVSDRTLVGSILTRAKLPGERKLHEAQQDLVVSILEHFRHVGQRVLVRVPPGAGAFTIAAELAAHHSDDDAHGWGLLVCATRAEVEQTLRRLERQFGDFALPIAYLAEGARAAPWYVATYKEVLPVFSGQIEDLKGPLKNLSNVILMSIDRASPPAVNFILEKSAGATVAAFTNRPPAAMFPNVMDHFRANDVHEYYDERYSEDGLRSYVLEDRRPIQRHPFPWGDKKLDLRVAMEDLAMTLQAEKRIMSKTLVICSSPGQLFEAKDAFTDAAPRHLEGAPRHYDPRPVRAHAQREFREFLAERDHPPFVIFCTPSVIVDVFETPPDVVAVLMNQASGKTLALWEAARSSRNDQQRPILVADYTGAVVSRSPAVSRFRPFDAAFEFEDELAHRRRR